MIYLVLSLSIVVFLICMKLFGVVESVRPVFEDSNAALAVMRSTELSDAEKEAAIQKAAIAMFGAFLVVTLRVVATLVVPAVFVWAGTATGLYTMDGAVAAAEDWTFLTVSSLVVLVVFVVVLWRDRRRSPA